MQPHDHPHDHGYVHAHVHVHAVIAVVVVAIAAVVVAAAVVVVVAAAAVVVVVVVIVIGIVIASLLSINIASSGSSACVVAESIFSRLHQPFAAASAPAMATAASMIANINARVEHIKTHVKLGAAHEDVAAEQFKALLLEWSKLERLGLNTVTEVCKHLESTDAWNRTQLTAFSACLRAGIADRLDQPGAARPMRTNSNLIYYLLQTD